MSLIQVCENESKVGQEKLNVALSPSQELPIFIVLRPSTMECLTATLLCRHQSSSNSFKWKVGKSSCFVDYIREELLQDYDYNLFFVCLVDVFV